MRTAYALAASLVIVLGAAAAPSWAHDRGHRGSGHHGHKKGHGHHGHKKGHRHHGGSEQGHKRHGHRGFKCDGTFTGITVRRVTVKPNDSCTLNRSTVTGDVKVRTNAYFEANDTSIGGDVEGKSALTIFIRDGSSVGGDVEAKRTPQLFLFTSTVTGDIEAKNAISESGHVQICGVHILEGDILVKGVGGDVLVGDPLTEGCPGNTVDHGSVWIERNVTDIELVVRGNTILEGSLDVSDNTGPSDKFVQTNTGGKRLTCNDNGSPFVGSPNTGWAFTQGQCS
jgi:cytoskeletal protein CcmA (bactofilin family)